MCPRAGKLWGYIGVRCENCRGIWPKNGRKWTIYPHTFILGAYSPAVLGSRCSFPAVFRLPAPSSARRCFAPQDSVRTAFCRISRALPMSATAHTTRGRQASTIRTRLNFGHIRRPYSSAKTTQTNVGNNLAMSVGGHWEGIINKGISAGSTRVLQKLGKKLNNAPITTAGSKLFCRSAGPNFARKSTFWLDTAQKHIYTNNVEVT